MAARIDAVELTRNPVVVKESFIIIAAIVTNGYLGRYTNAQLKSYTNGHLRLRGESVPTHAQLSLYRHLRLYDMTHQQIETMEV